VRVLWLLPKAAPALLRHVAGYFELAHYDLKQTQREITTGLVVFVVVVVCSFFAILMGCVAVVAVTWDTPHRLTAILCLAGGFLGLAIVAMIYRSKVMREQEPFLGSVRQEWQEDRVILERILSDEN
jgi:uncharacterized membrane protein YqjE